MTQKAVIFLLDRTGSMAAIKANTIESFNTYVETLKPEPDLLFTLLQFDSIGTDTVHFRVPIAEVPVLTKDSFQPRAATPLIDAACIAIDRAENAYKPEDKVVMVILTDGHENCSREFTMADLHDRIKRLSETGWQFVFLGASIDAYRDAGKMGIGAATTMSYDASDRQAGLRAMAMSGVRTQSYFATGQAMSFSDEEKRAVGDKFIPKARTGGEDGGYHPGGGGGNAPTSKRKSLVGDVKL